METFDLDHDDVEDLYCQEDETEEQKVQRILLTQTQKLDIRDKIFKRIKNRQFKQAHRTQFIEEFKGQDKQTLEAFQD